MSSGTTPSTPPAAAAKTPGWATDLAHKIATAVLTALMFGGFAFYQNTNAEIAALKSEVEKTRERVEEIKSLLDIMFPRQPVRRDGG
jgi:hypothetical protein